MTLVLIGAICACAFILALLSLFVGFTKIESKIKSMTAEINSLQELRDMHISNDRIIKAIENNPFITAYRNELGEWIAENSDRNYQIKMLASYDDLTAKLGDRELAVKIIAALPIDYGYRKGGGVSLENIIKEFQKYSDNNNQEEDAVKNAILGLLAAGFIKKQKHSWTEKKRNRYGEIYYEDQSEIRYFLCDSKEHIIETISSRPPIVPEARPKPRVQDFIDTELGKKWVEEAQIQLIEEELHNV